MLRAFALLLLVACGRTESLGGDDAGGAVVPLTPNESGLWGAGECAFRCEQFKRQLQDDFGVEAPNCWDSAMITASSFTACNCLFESRWGVTMLPSGADDCP
jgi:hypothetical protein